jgi:predicted methyltransferase
MKLMKRTWPALAVLALGSVAIADAEAQDQEARMREALGSAERSAEHKARDENDKPIEVVQFLGVEEGMTALDIISGGGYWTGVLSAAVGSAGTVYMHNPPFMASREGFAEQERAIVDRLGNVEPLHGDLGDADVQVDVAITSNNFHDQYNRGGEEAGVAFLGGVYAALKPGGVLGLIDHAGLPGENNAELHRIDADAAKRTLEAAGFVVEAESDVLANPDDPKTVGVRDDSVRGKTEKILIRARKPE